MGKGDIRGGHKMNYGLDLAGEKHGRRLEELYDRTGLGDKLGIERQAFFCIMASDLLFHKVDLLYDFETNLVRTENIFHLSLSSSGERALVKLAFDLYGGNGEASPSKVFPYLDEEHARVAIAAIPIRYNIS
jgi:hypothetical protein